MPGTPTLWQVLDSYLNTGDFDDSLMGWVSAVREDEDSYAVTFRPWADPDEQPPSPEQPPVVWHLVRGHTE